MYVRGVFGGTVCADGDTLFQYSGDSVEHARRVLAYFDTFHLLSNSKYVSFLKWRNVYRSIVRKEGLAPWGLQKSKGSKETSETNTPNSNGSPWMKI